MATKGLAARAPKQELTLADLGARVQEKREAMGMKRHELAVASGVNPSTIYRLEIGKHSPSFVTLGLIAKALGTTVVKLVTP